MTTEESKVFLGVEPETVRVYKELVDTFASQLSECRKLVDELESTTRDDAVARFNLRLKWLVGEKRKLDDIWNKLDMLVQDIGFDNVPIEFFTMMDNYDGIELSFAEFICDYKEYEAHGGVKRPEFSKMLNKALEKVETAPQKRIDQLKKTDKHSTDVTMNDVVNTDYEEFAEIKADVAKKRIRKRYDKKCKNYKAHSGSPTKLEIVLNDAETMLRVWRSHFASYLGRQIVPGMTLATHTLKQITSRFYNENVTIFNERRTVIWYFELFIKLLETVDWSSKRSIFAGLSLVAQLMNERYSITANFNNLLESFSETFHSVANLSIVKDLTSVLSSITSFQAQGDDDDDEDLWLDEIEKSWDKLASADITLGLSQMATVLVSAGMLQEAEYSFAGIEIFALKKAKEAMTMRSVFSALRKLVKGILSGVESMKQSGSFDGFLSTSSLEAKCSYALSLYTYLQIGQLELYADGMTVQQYLDQLMKLKSKLELKLANVRCFNRTIYTNYLNAINSTITGVQTHQRTQMSQETAFAVLITGESGVGKSWLSESIVQFILKVNDYPSDKENIITFNPNSAFDDSLKNNVTGCQVDDLGHTKPGKAESNKRTPTEVVLCIVSNIAWPALKADVAEKGNVFWHIKAFVATTNNDTLDTHMHSHKPGAILGRFKVHAEQIVKDEWRLPGSTAIDKVKVQKNFPGDPFPDVWKFDVKKIQLVAKEEGDGSGYTYVKIPNEMGGKTHNVRQFLERLRDMSKIHFQVEKENLKLRQNYKMELDPGTLLPVEVNERVYISQAAEPPHPLFEDDPDNTPQERDETPPEEQEVIEQAAADPRLEAMAAIVTSWRHGVVMTTLPAIVELAWVAVDGDIFKFLGYGAGVVLLPPFILALIGGLKFKLLAVLLVLFNGWILKDASVLLVSRTIVATSYNRMTTHIWRRCMERQTQKKVLQALAVVGGFGLLIRWLTYKKANYEEQGGVREKKKKKVPKRETEDPDEIEEIKVSEMAAKREAAVPFFSLRRIFSATAAPETHTMTSDQMMKNCMKNAVSLNLDGVGIKGFFLKHGILYFPHHALDIEKFGKEVPTTIITRDGPLKPMCLDFSVVNGRQCFQKFGTDAILYHCTGIPSMVDITGYFPEEHSQDGYSAAKFMHRTNDGDVFVGSVTSLVPEHFSYTRTSTNMSTFKNYCSGYAGQADFTPTKGMCGSFVIAQRRKPEIIGVHIAGEGGNSKKQMTMKMTKREIDDAIKKLLDNSPYTFSDPSKLHEVHSGKITSKELHKFSCAHVIEPGVPIEVIGTTGRLSKTKFQTQKTPFHEEVKAEFGVETEHGMPPNKGRRVDGIFKCPWENGLREISTGKNVFPVGLLMRAQDEFVDYLVPLAELYQKAGGLNRPLSLNEALNGVDGIKTARGAKMSTSGGYKFPGKKQNHLKKLDYPYEVDDDVRDAYHETLKCLREGRRCDNVLKANLKDEPLKIKKVEEFRTRIFFGLSFDMVLASNSLCTAFLDFMTTLGLEGCTAIGRNMESYDAQKLVDLLEWKDMTGVDPRAIIADFKHFDKSLPENLMQISWGVMRRVCEHFDGFNDEHLKMIDSLIAEMTSPVIDWNGVLMIVYSTHTSGNLLTTLMGSIAGLLMVMCSFYKTCDPDNKLGLKALDHVRSVHNGDDFVSTTVTKKFTFNEMQANLAKCGIEMTKPDKTSGGAEYQDLYDEDFLSRHLVWCPKRLSYVGRLKKTSIFKAILYTLPSSVEEPEVQLGQSLMSMVKEASLYDREFFDQLRSFSIRMAEKYNLVLPNVDMTYDDYVVKWAADSGKRYLEYRNKSKPEVEKIIKEGMYPPNVIFYATGVGSCDGSSSESDDESIPNYEAHCEILRDSEGMNVCDDPIYPINPYCFLFENNSTATLGAWQSEVQFILLQAVFLVAYCYYIYFFRSSGKRVELRSPGMLYWTHVFQKDVVSGLLFTLFTIIGLYTFVDHRVSDYVRDAIYGVPIPKRSYTAHSAAKVETGPLTIQVECCDEIVCCCPVKNKKQQSSNPSGPKESKMEDGVENDESTLPVANRVLAPSPSAESRNTDCGCCLLS